MKGKLNAMLYALLAAALYAVNVPFSKLLMEGGWITPAMLAGFLYIGAGAGMGIAMLAGKGTEDLLTRKDLPYTIAMVVLDIAAPILLMFGIAQTNAANVSLLNNLEIVATALIALVLFREKISWKLWASIVLVVASGILLGFEGEEAFTLNRGSLFVLAACLCWGLENNCTRSISDKSSRQIVTVKGLGSGIGGIAVAFVLGEPFPGIMGILLTVILGYVAYGLSIHFYIRAQKELGAAKTSAFYSAAPFLGVGFSFLILGEQPDTRFYIALAIMAVSTVGMVWDTLGSFPGYTHSHAHSHGGTVHTHPHRHSVFNPLHIHLHTHEMQKGPLV